MEESGYEQDLDFLIILDDLSVSYPTRIECKVENVQFRSTHL